MSKEMTIDNERVNRLVEYVKGLQNNSSNKEIYLKYKEDIDQVKPQEAFKIFHSLLEEGTEPKEILNFLDKVINVFYKSLSAYQWTKPENATFLIDLGLENKALFEKIEHVKELLKEPSLDVRKIKLIPSIEELQLFNDHYLKKENILFPYLEKKMAKFEGLRIMWALHDEVRNQIKEVLEILRQEESEEAGINAAIGKLFFGILGVVKKEELILFPAASEVLTEQDWSEMHQQSLEYGFPFIEKEAQSIENHKSETKEIIKEFKDGYLFKTETGELNFEQIMLVFNALPVDLTFVDEYSKVKYFTRPKDRIFPRSPAIIGRDVNNCHPPDSVHIVEKIVESFRSGKKDTANFWLNLQGRMVLIQYFALRDSKGCYKGTLEVSQDITDIQKLEGEKRLLEWD